MLCSRTDHEMIKNRKHKIAYLDTFEHTALFRYKLYQFDVNFVQLHYASRFIIGCTKIYTSNVLHDCATV